MMTLLKIVAIVVALGLLTTVALAMRQPDAFEVKRSAVIKAPADKVFAIINDFNQWPTWSPWAKLDPAMKTTVSGAASGKGAISEWDGNSKVGAGRTEILESTAPTNIKMKLSMLRPMQAENMVDYTLTPAADGTNVTWAMRGNTPFFGKVFAVFVDCDKMVGKDFETGLANLKAIAESK